MGTGHTGWGNVGRRHSNLTRSFTVRPLDKKQVACGHNYEDGDDHDHDVVIFCCWWWRWQRLLLGHLLLANRQYTNEVAVCDKDIDLKHMVLVLNLLVVPECSPCCKASTWTKCKQREFFLLLYFQMLEEHGLTLEEGGEGIKDLLSEITSLLRMAILLLSKMSIDGSK